LERRLDDQGARLGASSRLMQSVGKLIEIILFNEREFTAYFHVLMRSERVRSLLTHVAPMLRYNHLPLSSQKCDTKIIIELVFLA